MERRRGKAVAILLAILMVGVITACDKAGSHSAVSQANEAPASPSPKRSPLTQFESDLQYVRNGQYTYIWVFARKDGRPLDRDDAAYLRKNAPQVVDWVTTEQGKKVIGGTNFDLERGNLDLLKKRFVVEDYSAK